LAFGSVHPWAYTIIGVLVAVLYGYWIVQVAWQRLFTGETHWPVTLLKQPLAVPLGLLLAFTLLQLLPLPSWLIAIVSPSTHDLYQGTLTADYETTFRTLSLYPWATTQELLKLLSYIGIFFLILYHFRERIWLHRLVKAIVITGFATAVIGLLQHYHVPTMIYGFRDASYAHPFGPFVNQNHFAGYMEMVVFIAIGLLLTQRPWIKPLDIGWRVYLSRIESQISKQALLGFSVIVMASSLVMSSSRGGIISFVFAIMIMGSLLLARKRPGSMLVLVAIFSVMAFYVLQLGIGPVAFKFSSWYEMGIAQRLVIWEGTVDLLQDFPMLGTGLGTFACIYPAYQTAITPKIIDHAHSDYLEFFSEAGVVGGLLFWGSIVLFLIWTYRRWTQSRSPYVIGICLGSITGAISLLVHSTVDFNLHIPSNAMLFFIMLAIASNAVSLQTNQEGTDKIASPAKNLVLPTKCWRIGFLLSLGIIVLFAGLAVRGYVVQNGMSSINKKITLAATGELSSWVDTETLSRLRRTKRIAPSYSVPCYLQAKAYEQIALAQPSDHGRAAFLNLAMQEYRTAIDLEPTNPWYHIALGWVYLALSGNKADMKAHANQQFEIASYLAPGNRGVQAYIEKVRGH
jgi:O-antigen ligase